MTDAIRDRIAALADRFVASIAAERICDQFIVIDREQLPKVRQGSDSDTYLVDGTNVVFTSAFNAREWCLRYIAIWQHIEHKQDGLKRRRNELVLEFGGDSLDRYEEFSAITRAAIDRIIELEQAQP